jgi:hypothetical protein
MIPYAEWLALQRITDPGTYGLAAAEAAQRSAKLAPHDPLRKVDAGNPYDARYDKEKVYGNGRV